MSAPRSLIIFSASVLLSGCHKHAAPEPVRAPTPEAALEQAPPAPKSEFESSRYGFALHYPSDWSPRPSDDYELLITPSDIPSATGAPSVSMDVPSLPPHLPGMITISRIQDGLMKHLRKRFGNVEVIEERGVELPDSKARLLNIRWRDGDQPHRQLALLIIHANRVYILRSTAREADFERAQSAFEDVRSSLKWTGN